MRRFKSSGAMLLLVSALLACGGKDEAREDTSPTSVRGWISDIRTTPTNYTVVTRPLSDAAIRSDLLSRTNVYVEKAQFASGGISPNGAFILLDVPPGHVNVVFQIPGYPDASMSIDGVPANADVLIPGIVITPEGARADDPKLLQVRVPGEKKRALGKFATIGGAKVEIVETPLSEMIDRRDYPEPTVRAAAPKPLAIVR